MQETQLTQFHKTCWGIPLDIDLCYIWSIFSTCHLVLFTLLRSWTGWTCLPSRRTRWTRGWNLCIEFSTICPPCITLSAYHNWSSIWLVYSPLIYFMLSYSALCFTLSSSLLVSFTFSKDTTWVHAPPVKVKYLCISGDKENCFVSDNCHIIWCNYLVTCLYNVQLCNV